ncbi:hypothetical protein RchiOBHm_Chr3g0462941 [Rosa chinensis]|uniref:Uncharacterized protein n=1 Tax=Rosa chinensis TaxID=74649 RepID=A0A2P6R923_ROSCH|nr:hypothetical protein RchiOBHm_Chr3g0462941 [Rosa chinensis]
MVHCIACMFARIAGMLISVFNPKLGLCLVSNPIHLTLLMERLWSVRRNHGCMVSLS